MDIAKHRYFMMQVLLAIFRDKELSVQLAFKGGTSLMLFHQLPSGYPQSHYRIPLPP